jgi:DNA-binding NarL/FixJ family response regulator
MAISIYVASDSPVVRAGLRAVVEGVEEIQVAGEGGLAGLRDQLPPLRPDVLLLELPSSERGDLELLARTMSEMPELGVLLLSGDPGEGFARDALQAGVRGYLLRDVSPEEIVEAVRAVGQGLTVLHPATTRALLLRPGTQPATGAGELLSARELEVLRLLAQGLPSKSIAARLQISEHTVKFHVGSILGKLGAASRTEAVSTAIRRGLIAL